MLIHRSPSMGWGSPNVIGKVRLAYQVIKQTYMPATPVWYKKLKQQTFENNSNSFRTNLDPFLGIFMLPSENNKES